MKQNSTPADILTLLQDLPEPLKQFSSIVEHHLNFQQTMDFYAEIAFTYALSQFRTAENDNALRVMEKIEMLYSDLKKLRDITYNVG